MINELRISDEELLAILAQAITCMDRNGQIKITDNNKYRSIISLSVLLASDILDYCQSKKETSFSIDETMDAIIELYRTRDQKTAIRLMPKIMEIK